tara:strand:- start:48 stop:431 length:384 start_codon:yes stop_codon:yes gene_type:complete
MAEAHLPTASETATIDSTMSEETTSSLPDIADDTLLRRNPEIIATQIDGETVMMDGDFENYFGMAEIATEIWATLEVPISFSDLRQKLTAKWPVDDEQCKKDVLVFLGELQEQDMLFTGEVAASVRG